MSSTEPAQHALHAAGNDCISPSSPSSHSGMGGTDAIVPEPASDAWARLTGPLDTAAPVILTPAMRAASDADLDGLRTQGPRDRAAVDGWVAEALERVHGPLDAWLEHGRSA